jgi:dGTPase
MSPVVTSAAELLRDFLFEKVYNPNMETADAVNAKNVVIFLWEYFKKHQAELPAEYRLHASTIERGVTDYIAGMTDQYALRLAAELRK